MYVELKVKSRFCFSSHVEICEFVSSDYKISHVSIMDNNIPFLKMENVINVENPA